MGCSIWALGTILQLFFLVALANGDVLTDSKLQDNQESSRTSKVSPGLSVANGGASDFQCKRNGVFPVPGFCRDFYQCDDLPGYGLISTVFSCPLGTVFDDILNTCNLVSQVTTRPECTGEVGEGTKLKANEFDALIDVPVNGPPALNRQKRIAMLTVFTGLIALGSLAGAAAQVTSSVIANKKRGVGGIDLSSIENKLSGIDGKLKDINLSILESQIKNTINFETTQNLITKGMNENRANFEITQNIVSQGILQNRINAAITQGLIFQGNIANDLNFAKVQVSIGELKEFIGQEISKFKSEIRKGFESVSTAIDQSRIEPLVSKLLTLIKNFSQKSNHLQSLPEKNHRDEIERSGGYLEYLESSTIQDTLYDIIHQDFAIPISASDISAVFILDLLVQGLQIHASMMSSIVSSNVYLATKSLNERNVDEFNTYMLRVSSSTSRMKSSVGCNGTHGLIEEVKSVLHKVKQLPYASQIHGLNELLSEKETELGRLESDITEYINENLELNEPGQILGKPDFSISSSVLIGPWENGKQVSYAIQFVSDKGLSPIGEWSRPYTILDQANPIIRLPSADDGVMRLVYRRFNEETPELVAIVTDNEQTLFRDIGRDIINAASRSNEELAVSEVRALLDEGANVNITLENKMTPLHYASKYGNIEVMKILSYETADIHAKSLDDEEALHFAALSGAEEAVAYLITEGAFINAQTKLLSWSPLHIAVANNHVGATRILIQNGAFINIKDNKGLTPLHLSILGNGETMEVLLEAERLNVNAKADDGQTPLHYAARSSSAYFVKKLLEHKDIEVDALSDRHLSPLHYAAMGGNVEIVTELIQQEASVSLVDTYGSTPLHYAAFYGNAEAVLVLIEKDQSLKSVVNIEEKTAFDLANENNKTDVIQILRNETEYLINKIKEEIAKSEESKDSITDSSIADQAVSVTSLENVNCTRHDVQEMAIYSEETCVHIGHITNYVHVVMSKLPLVVQYEVEKSFTNIINNYNRGLEDAKRNANFWRNRDSILGRIQQTFKSAKDFEPTFNRKYKIKQERVAHHSQHTDENEDTITKAKGEISKLEEDLRAAQEAIVQVAAPRVKEFIQNSIYNLEKELETKRNIISVDPTTLRILQELIDFLEFVKDDASKIKQTAVNTKMRTVTFRNNLNADRELFERNSRHARNSLNQLQRQSIGNNRDLTNIQQTQERLQTEIEAQKRQISQLYNNMYKTHKELRDKRRELLKKMEKVSNLKLFLSLIASFTYPISFISQPIQALASATDRELITAWENNLSYSREEAARLETAVKYKEQLIGQSRDIIANGSRNSDTLITELNTFNKLDRDLQNIVVEIPSLQPSISQTIVGLEKIVEVFNTITQELSEMINIGKAANSAREKENALNSIHIRLSELQCYWKNISLYMVDLKQCSKNYSLVQPKQSLEETGH